MIRLRTIQEVIRGMSPDEVERVYFFQHPVKYDELGEDLEDKTVGELRKRRSELFRGFVESLLALTPKPLDGKQGILFLTKTDRRDERYELCLIYQDELLSSDSPDHERVESYAFELTPRETAMSFLVADNKLTQDHLTTVVIEFLWEISFFGYDEESVRKEAEKLKKSIEEARTDKGRPADDFFEEMREKHGWPKEEVYPREKELKNAICEADMEYYDYCRGIELTRIKEYLLKEGDKA